MNDLLAARSQMGISLAFHIIFAVVGIGMPALMVLAEWRAQRTGDAMYRELAKRWSKGTAILFAVGAVSGTVLSFELGLLWPSFMEFAGPIIGMPFSLEGFAFFTEAIFLGIYLYGWNRISTKAHLWSGVAVAGSGMISGVFVVMANAWMNAPAGFELVEGKAVHVDPIAALFNPAVVQQTLHMTIAAYCATGMAVAGIHAVLLLKHPGNRFHRAALTLALWVGVPAALLQPESGHFSAQWVAKRQPVKLAAMEGQFLTEVGAPLRIGGIPDERAFETRRELRREVARLVGVREHHERRRQRSECALQRRCVAVGGVGRERGRVQRDDFLHRCRREFRGRRLQACACPAVGSNHAPGLAARSPRAGSRQGRGAWALRRLGGHAAPARKSRRASAPR